MASTDYLILLSVSLFRETSAVRSRLCVSVSQCASQQMLRTDTCLYVLITDVYFSPTLASSRPPMALSLFACPERVQHRWHRATWLACHASIRQQEVGRANWAKFGELLLNTSRLLKVMQESDGFYILSEVYHYYLFPVCTVSLRQFLFYLHANFWNIQYHVRAYPVRVGVLWRVIFPLWHLPSAILSLSTLLQFLAVGPVALSDVRSRKHHCTPSTRACELAQTRTHIQLRCN